MPVTHSTYEETGSTLLATEYTAPHHLRNKCTITGSDAALTLKAPLSSDIVSYKGILGAINVFEFRIADEGLYIRTADESNVLQSRILIQAQVALPVIRFYENLRTRGIYPETADYYDLGTPSAEWKNLYIGTGKIYFGTGQDVNLYRSASGVLRTDDNFSIYGNEKKLQFDTTSYGSGRLKLTDRFYIDVPVPIRLHNSNVLEFGADVNLYRNAANQLRTDDDFYANRLILVDAIGVNVSGNPIRMYDWGAGAWIANFTKDETDIYGFLDMNSNKIVNVSNPTNNQDAATKLYADGIQAGMLATRDFFYSPITGTDAYQTGYLINSSTDNAYIMFYAPKDYVSIVNAVIVVFALATKTHRLNLYTSYGAKDENTSTHTGQALDQDIGISNGYNKEIDISALLSNLSSGDYVHIRILGDTQNIPNLVVLGFRFEYLS